MFVRRPFSGRSTLPSNRSLFAHLLSGWLVAGGATVQGDSGAATPVTVPAGGLTADELAGQVLKANPGLASLRAAAEAAVHRIEPAGALDDPMLSYTVPPWTVGSARGIQQKLDLRQRFPWPGTLDARADVARREAAAAGLDVDALQLIVAARAKSVHAEWRFVEGALAIHHATRTLINELIATAETRFAAGRGLKQDVLQAEVERASLDDRVLRLERQRVAVKARINALLGRRPDMSLPLPAAGPRLTEVPALETLAELALDRHPELARLDEVVAANGRRVDLAQKAFYPDFSLGIGYNDLWDDPNKRLSFGVEINVPLDRSRRRAEVSGARAEARSSEWALVERRTDLLAEIAEARASVTEAAASVALHEHELLPLAVEYLEAAVADYQSGAGAFLNVVTAEERALATELALARARADYARRLAELEQRSGGPLGPLLPANQGDTP